MDAGTGAANEEVADMDEDEVVDMDDDMEAMDNEPAANSDNIFAQEEFKQEPAVNKNIRLVRMYDLSITYDFYHRTPRLWL